MAEEKARIRVWSLAGEDFSSIVSVTIDRNDRGTSENQFPCKEWSIVDDMMNVSDAASMSIANPDGVHSGKILEGQRIDFDISDPDVAGGAWVRQLTGRVTRVEYGSDITGGSTILVSAMDLGWHLGACHATPLFKLDHGTLDRLIKGLVDPSWGFAGTTTSGPSITNNVLNRRLKQGRQGVARLYVPPKTILPFIQVEPGQTPLDILLTYLKREGLLLNVSARGELVLFRPDFNTDAPYSGIEYHGSKDIRRERNNVVGRPTFSRSIDGLYSEVQCWSTVVKPTKVQETAIANNPNAAFRHTSFKPDTNPLPFQRLSVVMDGEALEDQMRKNRAVFKLQVDAMNSWRYEAELKGLSQGGAFIVSDSMITVDDSVHKVLGTYYVQSVRRSMTIGQGARSKLTLRKPLLDPALERQIGGGARAIGG